MYRAGQTAGPYAKKHAGRAAENCEENAFCEHLTDEARASRAQSGANRHFALASRAAGEQDVFHVHASEQQNEGGENQEQPGYRDEEIIGVGNRTS